MSRLDCDSVPRVNFTHGGELSSGWLARFGGAAASVRIVAVAAVTSLVVGCVGGGAESVTPAEQVPGGSSGATQPGNDLQLFILFGQSNMEGAAGPEPEDKVVNDRVFVLGYDDACLGRKYNEWSLAQPPLHRCFTGLGPGDWFGKTMASAWSDAQIGLVPAAISGVDIDFFRKDVVSTRRKEFKIPPDDKRPGAYAMLLERAKLAQERGRIRGILFHQGESDTGQTVWLDKVAEIVANLRQDLALVPEEVPFIAGELPYEGCCSSHNSIVNQLPERIPNAHVVSAEGLGLKDRFHFDTKGQREMGKRYAEVFLQALNNTSPGR